MTDKQNEISTIRASFDELGKIKKEFTEEQVAYVMSTIAPTLNKNETWLFLMKASALRLNPLMGEIFAYSQVVRGERQLVIIAGRDGKRSTASKVGGLEWIKTEAIYVKKVKTTTNKTSEDGTVLTSKQETTIQVQPWDGKLWGAKCEVKRSSIAEPFTITVPLSEYVRNNNQWQNKPETMIKKVAESQALSAAYPELLTGVYDESERWDNETAPASTAPQIENGGEKATAQMLKTIEVLGGDAKKEYTKQEAINEIARLQAEAIKNKGKKPAAKPETVEAQVVEPVKETA